MIWKQNRILIAINTGTTIYSLQGDSTFCCNISPTLVKVKVEKFSFGTLYVIKEECVELYLNPPLPIFSN